MPNNPRSKKSRELRALIDQGMTEPQAKYIREICRLKGVSVLDTIEVFKASDRAKFVQENYDGLPHATKAAIHDVLEASIKAGPSLANLNFYGEVLDELSFPKDTATRKAGAH